MVLAATGSMNSNDKFLAYRARISVLEAELVAQKLQTEAVEAQACAVQAKLDQVLLERLHGTSEEAEPLDPIPLSKKHCLLIMLTLLGLIALWVWSMVTQEEQLERKGSTSVHCIRSLDTSFQ